MLVPGVRKSLTRMVPILALVFFHEAAFALDISNRYRSPRNPERKARASTELIVLHTTEAPARSSLNKLCDRGEAHFCVTEEGMIYRIVDRDLEAFHAGRSMWNGKEDVDKFSVGIECVGYHNKVMPIVQLAAIRDLVKELQKMYRIPDERVVSHCHVAYGAPNKWQKRRHRGRKRCGMLFAMPSVRRVLKLKYRPGFDADTRAGRLTIGDPFLQTVLYGGVDTMSAVYKVVEPKPVSKPPPKPPKSASAPPKSAPPHSKPAPPQPKPAAPSPKPTPGPAPQVAEKPARAAAESAPKSIAQLMVRGYEMKGTVSPAMTASKIAGGKWNSPDTFYTIRGKVIPGNEIDAAHIEKGMCIWMKK